MKINWYKLIFWRKKSLVNLELDVTEQGEYVFTTKTKDHYLIFKQDEGLEYYSTTFGKFTEVRFLGLFTVHSRLDPLLLDDMYNTKQVINMFDCLA